MKKFRNVFCRGHKLVGDCVLILLSLLLCVSAGCSSFNRDWKKAAAAPTPNGIEGRWQGIWLSDENGHTGGLRCLVKKVSEQGYRARFDSTYEKIFHFKSTVVLTGANRADRFYFSGNAKLPWWAGGVYHYEGIVSPTNFISTYRCKYDHGTFKMNRPEPSRQKAF